MLGLLLRVVLSLVVVLGIIWFFARGGRRWGGSSRLVRLAGRQTLSRTASLAVVQVADRVLVLGVSDSGVRLLTELDPHQVTAPVEGTEPQQGDRPGSARTALPAAVPGSALTGSLLSGSMLSGQTWKQAWAAATGRRDE